jgi:glutamate-1-semialdehyde 2,1-aminomutase
MGMARKQRISKRLFDRARRLMPGGVNSPVRAFKYVGGSPLFIERGEGSRITDADGNDYVDFCQSWGPLILGHAHPQVVEAVVRAAADGLSYGTCHKGETALAELVLSGFKEFDRVRFMSSGTEAVMTALRIARATTRRDLILKFDGGYHGHYDGMLVKSGSGLATLGIASSAGIPAEIARTTLVAPFDDEEAIEFLFKRHGKRIAAIIIEPLPANNGLLVQRREYLEFLRDVTRKFGALLIFDEVISGFRLRYGGYGQEVKIEPDLVTLGKIIGGGMPVGAVVGKAEIMESLSPVGPVYQAGTLSGNPVSLAAGVATLRLLKCEPVYEKLRSLGALFEATLAKAGIPSVQVQRAGSILWPYLEEGGFPRRADAISVNAVGRFKKIYWRLIEDGYYLPPSAYEVLFISFAHSPSEIKGLAESIVKNLLQTVQARAKEAK